MYKGHKVTKRLQRYMEYAETKYQKMNLTYNVDLWEVLESYDLIKEQPDCVKWYVHDVVKGEEENREAYKVTKGSNGCTYIKEVFKSNI